jgi:hypothetical protein
VKHADRLNLALIHLARPCAEFFEKYSSSCQPRMNISLYVNMSTGGLEMQRSMDFRMVQRVVREWRTLQRLLCLQRTQRGERLAGGGGARASRLGSCQLDSPGRRSGNDVNLQTHPTRITSLKTPCRSKYSFMACCQSLSHQHMGCVLPWPSQLPFAVQSRSLRTEPEDTSHAYITVQYSTTHLSIVTCTTSQQALVCRAEVRTAAP